MSIRVDNVSKSFGNFVALKNVSLDVPAGELVALLGPSGCGKTTLLRIIAGLESADSGRVWLDGEDASDTHVRERQVGFVFQHYALFKHMSVFENVAFGLRARPRATKPSDAEITARVVKLLELVQLDWAAKRFPSQLSGGQRQRIALARALAVEPRVLLLDEPFGALDAKVRKELRRWLRRLHDELHVTSVFVTHDQDEALEVADRIVLINRGEIEQQGAPGDVYCAPGTAFVFDFLGNANRFPVERGSTEHGFARPHETEVLSADYISSADEANGLFDAFDAQVSRVRETGLVTRVEAYLAPNLVDPAHRFIEIELSSDQAKALSLVEGKPIRVRPSQLHRFTSSTHDRNRAQQ